MAKKGPIQQGDGGIDGKEVAAAAAVAGAAAVGGKLAWDRLSSSSDETRAFRLFVDEAVPDGIRRIARGQLELAHADLDGVSKRKLSGGVHEARKRLKRLRATVRLARDALGEEVYTRENAAFRDIGRRLSGTRDAAVLIDTLDALHEAVGRELPANVTDRLRERLEEDRKKALASLKDKGDVLGKVLSELEAARTRTSTWSFDTDGFEALEAGLRRIYSRGRKALRRADANPSSENLHEWRKRTKDLWHALQILEPAAPKMMKKAAKRVHALADVLGDDHDLSELRRYVKAHPGSFVGRSEQDALVALIDRRRHALKRRALKLGARVFRRPPGRFVREIARGFEKRVESAAH